MLTAVVCPPVAAVTNAAVVGTGRSYLDEVEIVCDQTGQSCRGLVYGGVYGVFLHVQLYMYQQHCKHNTYIYV